MFGPPDRQSAALFHPSLLCLTPCSPTPGSVVSPPALPLVHPLQVDELYNHRTRLVCSAAAPPDQLFAGADHSEPIIDLEALQVGANGI